MPPYGPQNEDQHEMYELRHRVCRRRSCTECGAPITESESSNTNASQAKPEAREAERPAPAAQSGSTAKRPRERRIFGLSRRLALIIAAAAGQVINADRSGYTVKTGTYYAAPTAHTLADSHGRLYDLSEYSVNSYIIRPSLDGETAGILGKDIRQRRRRRICRTRRRRGNTLSLQCVKAVGVSRERRHDLPLA